ncbi:unnamed protein product [Heligmosomoides polygyrus]|uniref:RUN domain-containing protein n=1 Tax=Heligmosomoides polygyrus TaxID=6339 RepID=A0A183FM22_HELPZ|nr:unnamed protein product [Heligmosomoides polygyrus]
MLDELAFLIKGYDGVSDSRRKFVWLCRMFEVCREKPIRIRGKRVSSEFLHTHLRIRLCHLGLEDRKTVIENVLGSLREYDEQLYYFVLVATYRLSDDCLFESLHEYLMREWQAIRAVLWKSLRGRGVPERLITVVKDMYEGSKAAVRTPHGMTKKMDIAVGVSVLIDGACEFVLLYDRAKVPKLLDFFDQGDAQFSHDFPSICGEGAACPPIPRLPWDITPALNTHLAVPDVNKEDPIEPTDICPLDCRGLITPQYSELLASDELRLVAADTRPGNFCEILFFDREASASALLNLFDGVSSDLFQEKNGVFYLARNCKIGAWSIALSKVVMTPLLEMANRITSTWRAISGSIDSSANGGKLRQVVPLVFTLRCVRDSSLCPHARSACETVLRAVIRLAAMSVCVFVNSGRCDFKDRVFVEAVLSKVSPDRNGYGEIWESNFGVALPSSPEFSSRLCREVVKQGVLVRLLRTDIATVSGEVVDLLELYKLDDSQLAVDLDAELLKVSTHVEEVLAVSGEISVPTLENLVHWIVRQVSSAMFKICSHVAAAILRDVRSMCDVIRHLLLCAGSIDSEFECGKVSSPKRGLEGLFKALISLGPVHTSRQERQKQKSDWSDSSDSSDKSDKSDKSGWDDGHSVVVCNRTTVYKLRAELEAQRFDRRHISAVDVHIVLDSDIDLAGIYDTALCLKDRAHFAVCVAAAMVTDSIEPLPLLLRSKDSAAPVSTLCRGSKGLFAAVARKVERRFLLRLQARARAVKCNVRTILRMLHFIR